MVSVIRGDDNFDSKPYASFPIGVPFEIWDHFAAVLLPDNTGPIKFIRLTAGQSGAGGYNEGLLTDETVSGSAPLVEADAEIAVGPLAGQRVPLINTEQSFIRPGTSSGTLQFDQMQRITGDTRRNATENFTDAANSFATNSSSSTEGGVGAITRHLNPTGIGATGSGDRFRFGLSFDSANSPNARASSTTDGETRSKNRQATFYMRIV